MRERSRPKRLKFSSLSWLIDFLNLNFGSKKPADVKKVRAFLAEQISGQDDSGKAHKIQQRMLDLISLAIKGETPEGLVMSLNEYVDNSSESFDPHRNYPPVRAHWYARRQEDISAVDSNQAVLRMGKSNWVVQAAPLMSGTEGHLWLSVIQCLTNGELAHLRQCLQCGQFFRTDDARRKFCRPKHQKEYDARAAKARVKASRERAAARIQGLKPPKKRKDLPASPITDEQRFAEFVKLARGNIIPGTPLALFVVKKIPGEWRTVNPWLTENDNLLDGIWASLPEKTKNVFRRELWGTA